MFSFGEGHLRTASTMGRLRALDVAVGRLIRELGDGRGDEFQAFRMSFEYRQLVNAIWKEVDVDRDNIVSKEEALELMRVCSSQRSLSSTLAETLLAELMPEGEAWRAKLALVERLGGVQHIELADGSKARV